MDNPASQPPPESEHALSSALPAPQFTLQHLFVGMTAVAIALGLVASLRPPETFDAPPPRSFYVVASLIVCVVYSGPIAALLWASLFGWRREATFPREPGHWFLVLLGLTVIERWASVQLWILGGPRYSLPWPIWMYVWMLPWLAGAAVSFLAARKSPDGHWGFAFDVHGLLKVMLTVVTFFENLQDDLPPDLMFVCIMIAALLGLGDKVLIFIARRDDCRPRSILHRLGIIAAFEDFAIVLLFCCAGLSAG